MRSILFGAVTGLLLFFGILAGYQVRAQTNPTPVPLFTLVPPTLVPPAPTSTPLPPITRSALARIRERDPQAVVVGIPYNIRPFAVITDTGEIEGLEADIARVIAEDWGVRIEFRQVTRHNAHALLERGEIDLLMGQQVLSRDMPPQFDFSDPIFLGKQVALAMEDTREILGGIEQLGGQPVGVVIGSPGETAFAEWAAANNLQAAVKRYAMLDDGLRALGEREIVALVGDRWELDARVRGKIDGVRLLEGTFRAEPYAIAMLRYDENLRTLVNRTLQRLVASDRLRQIYDRWFPPGLMPEHERVFPLVWRDLDADPRTLTCEAGTDCKGFPLDIVRPERPMLPRLRAGEPLRVAGLGLPPGADGQTSPLEQFNQALVYEMARRWGVTVQPVPGSFANAEDVLASGAADLAVGLMPHWGEVDRIDYAGVYAERGYRLMVRIGSDVEGFGSLRLGRRAIATFADDPDAFEIARRLAISVGIPERTIQHVRVRTDEEAIEAVFERQSARVLFADVLRIVPLAAANTARVQLTERLYDPRPLAFGVPRNDVEFRLLIELTLQDMYRDGTYQRLWGEHWKLGEPLSILIWPGTATPLTVNTSG